MKNIILKERLDYWKKEYPNRKFLEPGSPLFLMINEADQTPGISWLKPEELIDFVDESVKTFMNLGLKGLRQAENESKPELLKPVIDLMKKHQNKIINSEISGDAEILIDGIRERITIDEINRHSLRMNKIMRTRYDVAEVLKDLIYYKRNLYQLPDQEKTHSQAEQPSIPEKEVMDLKCQIEHKPIFKPETIETIFDLLKGFFYPKQHDELHKLLDTGNNASEPLIFLSNGNRLADAFKQLIKSDVITGCDQIHLENWILKSFKYLFRDQITDYTPRYLNDIISTTKDKCQRPILNVKLDNSTGKIIIRKA